MPEFTSRLFAPSSRCLYASLYFFPPEYVICFDNFMTLRLLVVPSVGCFLLFAHELKRKQIVIFRLFHELRYKCQINLNDYNICIYDVIFPKNVMISIRLKSKMKSLYNVL